MEFWGVEVKPGKPLKVKPDFDKLVHVSQAALGEVKDVKGAKYVPIRLKIGTENYVIGSLSAEDRPQLMFDLVLEREFELSHDWKSGSVYFMGYIADNQASDEDDFFDESEDEEQPFEALENGKVANKVEEVKAALKDKAAAAAAAAVAKKEESDDDIDDSDDEHPLEALEIGGKVANKLEEVKAALKDKAAAAAAAKKEESDNDNDSDDESDDEEDSSDVSGGMDFDEVMAMSGSSSDEEMPKAGLSKKRSSKSVLETPGPSKKATSVTPNKTGNKSVHTATPFPSKKAGKTQWGKKAK